MEHLKLDPGGIFPFHRFQHLIPGICPGLQVDIHASSRCQQKRRHKSRPTQNLPSVLMDFLIHSLYIRFHNPVCFICQYYTSAQVSCPLCPSSLFPSYHNLALHALFYKNFMAGSAFGPRKFYHYSQSHSPRILFSSYCGHGRCQYR